MITGERVRLRAMEREDLPPFVVWLNDPEVTENLLIGHPFSMADENDWYESMRQRPQFERPLVIEVRESAGWRMIGSISLADLSWVNRCAELGIAIGDKTQWSQGYGTEAIHLLVNHAFSELNLNRVWLRVDASNQRGKRCYEKVGFRQEGTLREATYKHGSFADVELMSILRSEWELA